MLPHHLPVLPSVLIVDDEIADDLAHGLARHGWQVHTANSVAEGRRRFAEIRPRLLLVDFSMGDGTGLDVLAYARDFDPSIPCLLVSSMPRPAAFEPAPGMAQYLKKPAILRDLHRELLALHEASLRRVAIAKRPSFSWRRLLASRSTARWVPAPAIALVMAFGLGVALMTAHRVLPTGLCSEASRELTSTWNASRKTALETSIRRSGVPYGSETWATVEAAIDTYVAGLHEVRGQVCDGALPDPAVKAAWRLACIRRAAAELQMLDEIVAEGDPAVIRHAVTAFEELGTEVRCGEDASAAGGEAGTSGGVDLWTTERLMARSRAQHALGRYEAARETAREALRGLPGEAPPVLRARALYRLGRAEERLGELDKAEGNYRLAMFAATADAALQVRICAAMMGVLTRTAGKIDQARAFARTGAAALALAGHPPRLAAILAAAEAHLFLKADRLDEARRSGESALELARVGFGLRHTTTAAHESLLGQIEFRAGHLDVASRRLEAALQLDLEAFGAGHPVVANDQHNLGEVLIGLGRPAAALEVLKAAHATRVTALGAGHSSVALTWLALGNASFALGDYARAEEAYLGALGGLAQSASPVPTHLIALHNNLGEVYLATKRTAEAIVRHERALSLSREALGPTHTVTAGTLLKRCAAYRFTDDLEMAAQACVEAVQAQRAVHAEPHPELGSAVATLGATRRRQGLRDDGVELLREALAIHEMAPMSAREAAFAKLELALALWPQRSARREARALVTEARALYGEADVPQHAAALARWLGEHPSGS